MIPKKIHYCWFGKKEHPKLVQYCIESWKKNLQDYEIIEWNEDNFDINSNQFVKEAYKEGKYAFVSDYVRLHALYMHGGIYLDTDVEVIKSLDSFLNLRAFTGGENINTCVTGTMGAEPGHEWIKELLNYYKDKSFYTEGGKKTNTLIITDITKKMYGFTDSSIYRNYNNNLHVYPFEYFCAKNFETGKITVTSNTFTIHHFNGSWLTEKEKKKHKKVMFYKHLILRIFGEVFFEKINKVRKKYIKHIE